MGIGIHELHLLRLASRRGLGSVITLGRQGISLPNTVLEKELGRRISFRQYAYAEELLTSFLGATEVSSIDNSDYEGATYVSDLNEEINLEKTFDTVVDLGTGEHIFDVAQLFKNAIKMCKLGGCILHSVPANGECGHGLYQFSPDLFLSLYSERNGFTNTKIYIASLMDERHWYQVLPPAQGRRVMANSATATYILCITTKVREVRPISVYQSDYENAWEEGEHGHQLDRPLIETARNRLKSSRLAPVLNTAYRSWFSKAGLNRFNDELKKVSISEVITAS